MPDLPDTHLGKCAKCMRKRAPDIPSVPWGSHSVLALSSEAVRGRVRCNAATLLR